MFYAQSTITVITGRKRKEEEGREKKKEKGDTYLQSQKQTYICIIMYPHT